MLRDSKESSPSGRSSRENLSKRGCGLCRTAFQVSGRKVVRLGRCIPPQTDPYLRQGTFSLLKKLPEFINVRRTRHIHGHSNDSNRFHERSSVFGKRDIAKVNVQTGGRDLLLEVMGQAISRSYVEHLYGLPEGFQSVNSRRNDSTPIDSLCQNHIHDLFDKRGTRGSRFSGRSGNDWHFESIPGGKFDTSITNIAEHLISCSLMCGFYVMEGIGVSGKHRESVCK
jgi:hypothetical protein